MEENKHLNIDQISLRSEMAREVLSNNPDFSERWSLLIFLIILLVVLSTSWFIKYPDIIEASATLTAANAPKEIILRQEGRLERLFARNNGKVDKNEVFGWIESTADHRQLIDLSARVDSAIALLTLGRLKETSVLFGKKYEALGEMQSTYQQFITAWQLFNDYMINGFYERKKGIVQNDCRGLEIARKTILEQKELATRDLKLAEETFRIKKQLFDEKVISKDELRAEESKFLNKEQAIPLLDAALASNDTQEREKIKELDQLDHDLTQEKIIFQQALQSLKSAVDDWKKKYLLQSPVAGTIFFTVPLQENQFLPSGKLLGYISPDDSHIYAEANLPQINFGKIDTGMKVQLRLAAYPYQEAGFLEGTLNYVSRVASDSGFLATVRLDKGLLTAITNPSFIRMV